MLYFTLTPELKVEVMNKFIIVALIVVLALVAFFALSPKPTTVPESVSGTLPQANDNTAIDQQTAELAASLISTSPENADVFILEPGDGATVTSPLTVKFGITGMEVVPAGQNKENSGHHHLLINLDSLPPMNQPLPASDQLIHYGAGQTETELDLEPGTYTLQLLLGNYLHIPHDPPVLSKKISITVE